MAAVTGKNLIQRKLTIQQNNLLSSRKIDLLRSEVDAALQEHIEEVQKPGQRMKRTPELINIYCPRLQQKQSE